MKKLLKFAKIVSKISELVTIISLNISLIWTFRNCGDNGCANDSVMWYVIPLVICIITLYIHNDANNFIEDNYKGGRV